MNGQAERPEDEIDEQPVPDEVNDAQDDDTVGVLGVIGPTRMAYDRVVPIVDVTARLLESALSQKS